MSILDKASLIQIPSGYKSTKLYSLRPSNGTGDFTFARSSSGIRVNSEGLIEEMSANVPRLDYSDGSCASLLLEGQSTNILPYSEDFANSAWSKSNVTLTSNNTISPDGTQNASKLVSTGADGNLQDSISVASGTTYTFSVYLKTISGTLDIAISLGSPGFPQNEGDGGRYKNITVTNEWKRYTITSTADASASTGVGVGGFNTFSTGEQVYVWGAQLEAKNYVSSYIPTSGSTVTRTADVCNNAGTAATFNSTEGVLFAEIAALADDGTYRMISLSDGTATNRITFFYQNSPSNTIAVESAGSGTNLGIYGQSLTITNSNKIAIKYKANDCALWVNGVEVATDTSFAAFSSGTFTKLSFDRGDGIHDFYGKCNQIQVYNTALTDTELAALTTL